ncbi:ribosome assembly cofactor RimP [Croceitalea rosinachiae]|uniref:Ribosome maturation factor RimP n=1 Tax=Croceitalea rosinachiae TaxID=3075596 RepID=A0ABU3A6A0_9FLAO|nr:ribosome assembly cofactor RimP [Croceitalea sp. F388]MDT0605689.1 ribosome assembly cofactor RimP [Croceitalea sp. F388]
MFKEKVTKLLNGALGQRKDLFLIDFMVDSGNKIRVVLDGDEGINLKDCMDISRAIEHNLDREEEDFSLEVTSAGATTPLVLPRQYKKNIGRTISVKTETEKFEGYLTAAGEEEIILEWKAREPKPIGKGKHTVQKKQEIAFSDIKEAKVILKF